jgi:hypothetical protein
MLLLEMPATRALLETCGDEEFKRYLDEVVLPGLLANFAERAFDDFKLALLKALPQAELEQEHASSKSRNSTRRCSARQHQASVTVDNGAATAKPKIEIRCRRDESVKSTVRMKAKVRAYRNEYGQQTAGAQERGRTEIRGGSISGTQVGRKSTEIRGETSTDSGEYPFASRIGDVLRASIMVEDAKDIRYVWEQLNAHFEVVRMKNTFMHFLQPQRQRTRGWMDRVEGDADGSGSSGTQAGRKSKVGVPHILLNVWFDVPGVKDTRVLAELQVLSTNSGSTDE